MDKKWEEENQITEQDVSIAQENWKREIMQGGRAKRKIILEGEEIEWGEAVTEVESDKQIFPKTKNVEPLIKRA